MLLALAWLMTGSAVAGPRRARARCLLASGLLGLVLGDLGFFHALAEIGPRLSSVMMASWPAFTVRSRVQRRPLRPGAVRLALMIAGVCLVLLRSREGAAWNLAVARQSWIGVVAALFAALGQAGGFVLARLAMAAGRAPQVAVLLHATVVRMVVAVFGLMALSTRCSDHAFVAVCRSTRAARRGARRSSAPSPACGSPWWRHAAARRRRRSGRPCRRHRSS